MNENDLVEKEPVAETEAVRQATVSRGTKMLFSVSRNGHARGIPEGFSDLGETNGLGERKHLPPLFWQS